MKTGISILTGAAALAAVGLANGGAWAQPAAEQDGQSHASLDWLIGSWDLTTTYANGAVGRGERVCAPAMAGAYIRCNSSVTFDNADVTRQSVNYINYNARRGVFEEIWLWQFPAAKKLTDLSLDETGAGGSARGYIYAGDGAISRRIFEQWAVGEDNITITVKSNSTSQPPDEWPVFLEDRLTRKRRAP